MLAENMRKKLIKLLTFENIIIVGFLITAFLLRIFRVSDILAFHYDQGRDALVIWDLIREPHKLFLIGPTTGLPGVFRGAVLLLLNSAVLLFWAGKSCLSVSLFGISINTRALFNVFIGEEHWRV